MVNCPECGVELKQVQKEYEGKFFLIFQCPICFKVADVFATATSEWTGFPMATNIDDETMEYLKSCMV